MKKIICVQINLKRYLILLALFCLLLFSCNNSDKNQTSASKKKSSNEVKTQENLNKKKENSEKFFLNGLEAINKGQIDQALNFFAEALKIYPEYEEVYVNRGILYYNMKKHDLAIRDLSIFLEMNSDLIDNLYKRIIQVKGEDGAFLEFPTKLTPDSKIYPVIVTSMYARGVCYLKNSDFDKAIEDFSNVIKIYSDNQLILYERRLRLDSNIYFQSHISRGKAYGLKDKHDFAADDFSKALEIEPNDEEAKRLLDGAKYLEKKERKPSTAKQEQGPPPTIIDKILTPGDEPLVVHIPRNTKVLLKVITEVTNFNEVKLMCQSYSGKSFQDNQSLFKDTERIFFLPEDFHLEDVKELKIESIRGHIQIQIQYPPEKQEYEQLKSERLDMIRRLKKNFAQ